MGLEISSGIFSICRIYSNENSIWAPTSTVFETYNRPVSFFERLFRTSYRIRGYSRISGLMNHSSSGLPMSLPGISCMK